MADLMVTMGADTSELEKNVKNAGKTIEKELGKETAKGKGIMGGINFAEDLMSGKIGSAIGGLFGPLGQAVGAFVDQLASKAKELMDSAIQLRNLSYQTNLSPQQLQGLENVAKATGIGVNKLSDSISEYNRRIGYARTHGSEMNYLLNKLGVSFADIKNGTFTYFDAIEALGKAQAAGTDEAILNHYANVMLGSSYKELLPLIKMGSDNLKNYSNEIYKTSQASINALSEAGDAWNTFTENVKNLTMELLGWVINMLSPSTKTIAKQAQRLENKDEQYKDPDKLIERIGSNFKSSQPKERKQKIEAVIDNMALLGEDSERVQELKDALARKYAPGINLNPFGAGPAQGASQMQQMGGGDLFGAVSFSPMQRVADNTDEINKNVEKIVGGMTIYPEDPERVDLNR